MSQQIGTRIELAGRRKDGSEFPIEIMLGPPDSREGIVVTASAPNISERGIAQLRESEAGFRMMANNISQLAWMADETGRIFWYNRRWFDYSGVTLEERAGSAWQSLQHPDHVQRVSEGIQRCFRAGTAWEDTLPLRGRDGSYRWFLSQVVPVRDSGGKVLRWFGTHTDISEIRSAEEEWRAEKERAQEAREERARLRINAMERALEEKSHLQEAFLSHVSHELRTPLTAIHFFTTNLLDGLLGDLTAEQHEHLERSLTNISQLHDMVDDLLDITRVDTHKLRLEPGQASPRKFIVDVLSTCRKNAEGKHINLNSEAARSLPFVWADVSRVRQILINLIDNAIKFTPDGGSVTVGSRPLKNNDDSLCLFVSDTGCGISPENVEVIFDRLAQLDNAKQASRSGLGLGLFIARELVSLHGGRIWVESPPGKGCTFYFTLPLFSLSKLCADIFTDSNLGAGHVTLIAIDVCAIEGAAQAEIQPEIQRLLWRCIHPGQDLLLPPMSEAETVVNYFIVACTDAGGAAEIANRISRELQNFDSASKLRPVISSTTLLVTQVASRKIQAREIAARIEGLVQMHLERVPSLDQGSDLLVPASIGSF